MRLRAQYWRYEGAQAARGVWVPLVERPARMVLNMVADELLHPFLKDEDRTDIENWLTCTVQEAIDFQRDAAAEDLARQKRLLGTIGEVG